MNPCSRFFARAALLLFVSAACAQTPADSLEQGFRTPPDSAKPRTWWHWTASNVTKEGITKDLEWMKRAGIAGFMLADVNSSGPSRQLVEPKIPYGTPEWFDAVRHAAAEADRLGLEMSIFSSPGWSETGGPWVKPEQAMKKLVWSETTIEGPRKFSGKLAEPPRNNGQIRNTGATYYPQGGGDPTYYGDSAVIAYRAPADDMDAGAAKPVVTTNNGPVDGAPLLDDQLNTTLSIAAPKEGGGPAWVQFEFPQPFTARAFTIGGRGGSAAGIPVGRLVASDDGKAWRTLVTLPGAQLYRQGMVRTFAFTNPVTAKFFRIEMTGAPLGPAQTMSQAVTPPAANYVLSEAILHRGARVQRWEEKAGFSFLFEYETVPTPAVPASEALPAREVIDLTAKMKPDGTLEWDAPAGQWTVLRLGYSLTGAKNRPATPAGSGFEADKLSRKHMEAYYHGYFDPLEKALGPLFGKSLRYVMMDSWEAGTNNWTDEILAQFRQRRGYDPTPYLPVLTGHIVENADVSDRFTWDFRRTLADLWADAHYGTMAEKLREHGIGIYAEAAGVSLEMPEDTLLNKSKVEIPAGEFWVRDLHPRLMYLQDVRGAASASHVYGKPLVAAESFTGGGYESPFTLKKVSDYWLAQGVNRLVFHTSAHQPLDTKPGNTMVGTHLNRNITWAEQAAPFFTYLARQCFMLQQGKSVADLVYLLNEGAPSTPPIWAEGTMPPPPAGHDYDFINADVLLHRLSVAADGRLTLPDGVSYRVLVLPQTDRLRPELLKKIRELVNGGAIVVGQKPTRSPSLANYPACDDEVGALGADIWGDLDGASRTIRHVGKGVVYWGWTLDQVLAKENVGQDFDASRDLFQSDLAWAHRRTETRDIYYVANLSDLARSFEARFRTTGAHASVWHPVTGTIEPAAQAIINDISVVPMHLAERESVFVVFDRTTEGISHAVAATHETPLMTLNGPWDVRFPENLGAPPKAQFATLRSWTSDDDPGVKYFSGTATYTKTFTAPAAADGARVVLDLGKVGDIAEVSLNGRALGELWCAPYRVDVTDALKPGENQLEVKITNEWTNRIAGDRVAPAEKRILATSPEAPGGRGGGGGFGAFANAPLPESGLIGPVTLLSQTRN
ncbi:MAG TPA: glycosyl hydrolase [Opitutaceae bacterium]|nr:glycosyl hydrolase [Opitutaceae bacterium]